MQNFNVYWAREQEKLEDITFYITRKKRCQHLAKLTHFEMIAGKFCFPKLKVIVKFFT